MPPNLIAWIAAHALTVWAFILLLALLAGDLAWQRSARLKVAAMAGGRRSGVMRRGTGLLLVAGASLLFAGLAFAVAMGEPGRIAAIDTELAEQMQAQVSPVLLATLATITSLGSEAWITGASLLVLFVLLLRGEWWLSLIWAIAQLGLLPLTYGIKSVVERPRPLHSHGFVVEHGWSFPSGHAMGAMVFYGMLAYVALRLLPSRWHRAVIAACVLMVGVIGGSRIVLQVHYLSDVVAGYSLGLAWLVICMAAAEWHRLRATA